MTVEMYKNMNSLINNPNQENTDHDEVLFAQKPTLQISLFHPFKPITTPDTDQKSQYLEQAQLLIDILKQNPKTLIQANQLSIYMHNHDSLIKKNQLGLVLQGYEKLEIYLKTLTKMCSGQDELIWAEQVEL